MSERYTIESGVARQRQYPKTFQIPPADVRRGLLPGDMAKLIFADKGDPRCSERMWVVIVTRDGDKYLGVFADTPVMVGGLRLGDVVEFGPDDVIDYERPAN